MDDTAPYAAEWRDALAPDLRKRTRAYLQHAITTPPESRKEWSGERALAKSLQEQMRQIPVPAVPIPIPVVGMIGFFATFVAWHQSAFAFTMVLLVTLAVAVWSFALKRHRTRNAEAARETVLNGAFQQALFYVVRTRTERAYRDAVMELLPAQDGFVSAELRREQMERLNTLLESGTRLDTVRAEIASALTGASPESLRAEAEKLRVRQAKTTDPEAQSALAQSVALCEERLVRAEALTTLAGRIEAEQELVYQAFRTAQSSWASLRITPAAEGSETAPVVAVAETTRRQAQAIEAAMQELGVRS